METSCDDTAAAWLEVGPDGFRILGSVVESQDKLHARYGGVMPRLAAKEHERRLPAVAKKVIEQGSRGEAGDVLKNEVDVLAVTTRPGLEPALLVGAAFVQTLAFRSNTPVVGVDHLSGHLASAFVEEVEGGVYRLRKIRYPAVCLVVSGGHTNLYLLRGGLRSVELVGQTRDDAAGEAFDKVARMLGLGYPGGPAIEAAAGRGRPHTFSFPRPLLKKPGYDFSFAGLKTAVMYELKKLQGRRRRLDKKILADVAASFQQAVVETLVVKTIRLAKDCQAGSVMLSGGVAANSLLRRYLQKQLAKKLAQTQLLLAPTSLTADNAVMIAMSAGLSIKEGRRPEGWQALRVQPTIRVKKRG